jgi:hypothetical protein
MSTNKMLREVRKALTDAGFIIDDERHGRGGHIVLFIQKDECKGQVTVACTPSPTIVRDAIRHAKRILNKRVF